MIQAWHFTASALRDGRPIPPAGEWLVHRGPVCLCASGLHASERLLDALAHAPGRAPTLLLHRVDCDEIVERSSRQLVCRRRRIEASRQVEPAALVRLAAEAACLAAWCAGLYLPDLLAALEAADREDWQTAGDAALAAARAASAAADAAVFRADESAIAACADCADATAYAAEAAYSASGDCAVVAYYAASATETCGATARDCLEVRAAKLLWQESCHG